jgi:acyl-coenzyme A thioesterase PaaI-like protein
VAALRILIGAARRADAPPAVLEGARALIDEATALLHPYRYDGVAMQSTLRGPNSLPGAATKLAPSEYFPYSPIVGPLNAISPPVQLRFDGERIHGEMTLGAAYAGPPGTVHGGVVALIFDELLGCVNVSNGYGAFTGTLTIRYERPSPLDTPLQLESWIDRIEGRKVFTSGTISHDGAVTARATAVFIQSASDAGSSS